MEIITDFIFILSFIPRIYRRIAAFLGVNSLFLGVYAAKIMTDKDIIKKIRHIEQLESVKKGSEALASYNTGEKIHLKQLEFHKCPKRNRWVFGGNRSGKTECGAVEAVWIARGIHPYRKNRPNTSGWVVSLTREVQRDVAQQKILKYLAPEWIDSVVMVSGRADNPEGGVIDYISVKNVFGGISRIGFKSCEMGREKFQGASLDFVWFDEEPPEDIYDECRMRVLDKKGDIFATMTPLKGLTFVYNRIYLNDAGDDQVWHIFMEWADNPYLDPQEITALSASLSKTQLESRRYGRFCTGRGLVYEEFDERTVVIPPFKVPKDWYDCLSIDPGLNNPLSCHWYAVDGDGNIYVIMEHYEAGKDILYHCDTIKSICRSLDWKKDSFGRYRAFIDSAANQHTLSGVKSVAELFCENGIQVDTSVDKDLFTGISRVKQYLRRNNGAPNLFIFDNCVNLIREIKGYWWGEGDTPRKKDDHALDELRYFVMSKPAPPPPLPKTPSDLERFKLKLIKNSGHR